MPQEQEAEHLVFRRLWKPRQAPKTQDADWRWKRLPLLLLSLWHSWWEAVMDGVTTYTHMPVMSGSTLSIVFLCCLYRIFIKAPLPTGYGDRLQWLSACLSYRGSWVLSPVPTNRASGLIKKINQLGPDMCHCHLLYTQRVRATFRKKRNFHFLWLHVTTHLFTDR